MTMACFRGNAALRQSKTEAAGTSKLLELRKPCEGVVDEAEQGVRWRTIRAWLWDTSSSARVACKVDSWRRSSATSFSEVYSKSDWRVASPCSWHTCSSCAYTTSRHCDRRLCLQNVTMYSNMRQSSLMVTAIPMWLC